MTALNVIGGETDSMDVGAGMKPGKLIVPDKTWKTVLFCYEFGYMLKFIQARGVFAKKCKESNFCS